MITITRNNIDNSKIQNLTNEQIAQNKQKIEESSIESDTKAFKESIKNDNNANIFNPFGVAHDASGKPKGMDELRNNIKKGGNDE